MNPTQGSTSALTTIVGRIKIEVSNVTAPVSERYQVALGGLLTVRIWSPTVEAEDLNLRVCALGAIRVGSSARQIVVRGQTLIPAEQTLKRYIEMN